MKFLYRDILISVLHYIIYCVISVLYVKDGRYNYSIWVRHEFIQSVIFDTVINHVVHNRDPTKILKTP